MRITIEIDTRQKAAKAFLEFIKSLPFVKFIDTDEYKPNKTTKKAILDARKGKTYKVQKKTDNIFDDIA